MQLNSINYDKWLKNILYLSPLTSGVREKIAQPFAIKQFIEA